MGLAVATALARQGGWHLHLLDLNVERGEEAAKSLGPSTQFHKTNVTSYASLASIFDKVFKSDRRIDLVFANAGIVERDNFYAEHPTDDPPPEPNQLSIDINLKAVVTTSYLAQHYFRRSPGKGKGMSLVMTASCGGLYPSPFCPMYSASKRACRISLGTGSP
jgi:NAD(P)-dependent dehydrogenase (short-subunit alcohol dehydrogenase family)